MKKFMMVLAVLLMTAAIAVGCGNQQPADTSAQNQQPAQTEQSTEGTQATQDTQITEEKAKEIAYNHAGVNVDNIVEFGIEFDQDINRDVFEVDFTADGYEYSYDIDATTGEIIKYDKELHD